MFLEVAQSKFRCIERFPDGPNAPLRALREGLFRQFLSWKIAEHLSIAFMISIEILNNLGCTEILFTA